MKTMGRFNAFIEQRDLKILSQGAVPLPRYHLQRILDLQSCQTSKLGSWNRDRDLFHKSRVDLARAQTITTMLTTIKTSSIKKSKFRVRDKELLSILRQVYSHCKIRIVESQVKIQWRSRRLEALLTTMMNMQMKFPGLQELTSCQTKRCYPCKISSPYWLIVSTTRGRELSDRVRALWTMSTVEVYHITWSRSTSLNQGCTIHHLWNIWIKSMCKVCRVQARKEEEL